MSKRAKQGVDLRSPNPTHTKRMGRSRGPLVFNEHVVRLRNLIKNF